MSNPYTISIKKPVRSISLKPIDDQNPKHAFNCECKLCLHYEHRTINKMLETQQSLLRSKIQARIGNNTDETSYYYQWVLSHLLIPHNKIVIRGIDIHIPEIVFYKDNEPYQLFLNKDHHHNHSNNPQKYNEAQIKKISKQKISSTLLQKIMNEKRRKYRQLLKKQKSVQKQESRKPKFAKKQIRNQVRDGVVVRYKDGFQELLSENQFFGLCNRRKQDAIWKKISFIRNFISLPPYSPQRLFKVKYDQQQINFPKLHQRAETLMKIYGKKIIYVQDQYISEEEQVSFSMQIMKQSPKINAEYLVYKIVWFIQYFYDIKITKLTAEFIHTQIDHLFLTNVSKLQIQEGMKFDWTAQVIEKKVKQQEERIFVGKEIPDQLQDDQHSKIIENTMRNEYEQLKQKCGLNAVEEDNQEQVQNNKCFKKLHPQFDKDFSDILKNPQISVSDFKTKYLGYKSEKKPIVKDFNSIMIKTIHHMSPKLKRAQQHDYFKAPNRTLSPLKIQAQKRFSTINNYKKTLKFSEMSKTLRLK